MPTQTTIATNDVADVIRAIGALAAIYDNGFTDSRELAIAAAQSGAPAFWTKATYHNQAASLLVDHANRFGLTMALAQCADEAKRGATRAYLLSTLIPLNRLAQVAWERAW